MKNLVLFFFLLCSLTACKYQSLNEMLKEVAEQQVDTTGYVRRVVYTEAFTSVAVNCFSDITYHQIAPGEQPYVILRAPQQVLEHMECVVVDDECLRLELTPPYRQPESVAFVIDIYAPIIDKFTLNGGKCLRLGKVHRDIPLNIELNGSGAILCESMVAPDVVAELNGAGHIDLQNIRVNSIQAHINGVGNIVLSGQARKTSLQVNGEGNIDTNSLTKI